MAQRQEVLHPRLRRTPNGKCTSRGGDQGPCGGPGRRSPRGRSSSVVGGSSAAAAESLARRLPRAFGAPSARGRWGLEGCVGPHPGELRRRAPPSARRKDLRRKVPAEVWHAAPRPIGRQILIWCLFPRAREPACCGAGLLESALVARRHGGDRRLQGGAQDDPARRSIGAGGSLVRLRGGRRARSVSTSSCAFVLGPRRWRQAHAMVPFTQCTRRAS